MTSRNEKIKKAKGLWLSWLRRRGKNDLRKKRLNRPDSGNRQDKHGRLNNVLKRSPEKHERKRSEKQNKKQDRQQNKKQDGRQQRKQQEKQRSMRERKQSIGRHRKKSVA